MVNIKLCLRLKDSNCCDGCPIYFGAKVFESWLCPVGNWKVKHTHVQDKTYYGRAVRPEACKRKEVI